MNINFKIDRTSALPLYIQLAEAIKYEITNGTLSYGDKLPSENELTAQLGLSRMTVRSALTALVNDQYIEKAHGKGTFVCYKPQTLLGHIDVLLDITYSYFATHYIQSISDVLTQNNYRFIIHDTKDSQEETCHLLEDILTHGSAGIILQPSHKAEPLSQDLKNLLYRINARGIPYIMLDRSYHEVPGFRMVFDDYSGGRAAAEYLISLGHKNFAMVCCSKFYENRFRLDGFNSVLYEYGLTPLVTLEDTSDLNKTLIPTIKEHNITAIFNYNDEIAAEVLRILHSSDLNVPENISVVGFDDTVIAESTNPQLTSVVHPKNILGKFAAEKLLSAIDNISFEQDHDLLSPKLHIRSSCSIINP